MKTSLPFLIIPLLFTAALVQGQDAAPAAAQNPPRLVSTTGSAEIHVVPDLADLSFDIEVRNANLANARKAETAAAARLLAALRAAGVTEQELQTSQVAISPDWTSGDRSSVQTASVRFYSVSQTVSCTVHTISKVPDITAAAIAAGATGVSEAVFRTSDLRKYRDQARAMAIKAAKEKADALAGELGAKTGKPWAIEEEGQGQPYPRSNYPYTNIFGGGQVQVAAHAPAAGDGSDTPLATFAPGSITVGASVSVSFLLE
ncbi:MAG TPA: SIMPL domain-containing protein [Chthoniobacteraceae bacterium]|nr:SIMPL domain-containing protein [Chthoniobacteraceae bacterium]